MNAAQERMERIQRQIADMVTDELLSTKVDELTVIQTALLQAALNGPHSEEIVERLDRLANA